MGAALAVGLAAGAEGDAAPSAKPKTPVVDRSPKAQAYARAMAVLEKMGLDTRLYVGIALDKSEQPSVLADSEIRPYVLPAAIEADWWMVVFVPQKSGTPPPVCVYLDKQTDAVRGYVIGPPSKPQKKK